MLVAMYNRLHSSLASVGLLATISYALALVAAAMAAADSSLSLVDGQPRWTFRYSTPSPDSENWIGVYYAGSGPQSSLNGSLLWKYAPEGEASVRIEPPTFPPGAYKAFFFAKGGYEQLAPPIDVFIPGQGPLTFIVEDLATKNARQGAKFEVSIAGLLLNQPDSTTRFAKAASQEDCGADWVQVSSDGIISGTPGTLEETRVAVQSTASNGAQAKLRVKIPIRQAGARLVDRIGVLSFNIWEGGINVADYHWKQVRYLASAGVDIVGLQESNGVHAKRLGHALGWDSWQGQDVGIISRYPIVETFQGAEAAGSVRIALDGNASQVIVWNAHLAAYLYGPYGFCFEKKDEGYVLELEKTSRRQLQIEQITSRMAGQIADADRVPVLLTGDFNAPSHLDWTDSNQQQHCGIGSMSWPTSVEPIKAGLIDSYREIHPDFAADRDITWSPIFLENRGRHEPLDRIDFIYYKGLRVLESLHEVVGEPKAMPNHRDNEWTSDHKAVKSIFSLPER